MARAPGRPTVDGIAGSLTDHVKHAALDASAKKLRITNPECRRRHDEAVYSALVFYRSEVDQQTAVNVRAEVHRVANALAELLAATRPIRRGETGGISDTTRGKIAAAMRWSAGGISKISFNDLLDAVSLAHIDVAAIDDEAKEPARTYSSRAPALADLGVMLVRLYERHHPSHEFVLGELVERLNEAGAEVGTPTFTSPAFKWFDLIMRALVPEIRGADNEVLHRRVSDSEVRTAAKQARSIAGQQDEIRLARASYYLALTYAICGQTVPTTSDDAAAVAAFEDWLHPDRC